MDDLDRLLNKKLKEPEFKKEWDKLELRYAVIRQLIKIRNTYNLSQAQLAEKLNSPMFLVIFTSAVSGILNNHSSTGDSLSSVL